MTHTEKDNDIFHNVRTTMDEAIRSAIRKQIKALGGLEATEALIGISKAQLSRVSAKSSSDPVSIPTAMALDEAAGEPAILRVVAALLGYKLVPFSEEETQRRANDLAMGVSDLSVKAALAHHAVTQAKADGVITPHEKKEISDCLEQVASSLAMSQRDLAALDPAGRG